MAAGRDKKVVKIRKRNKISFLGRRQKAEVGYTLKFGKRK
jgi:hypothetical protein